MRLASGVVTALCVAGLWQGRALAQTPPASKEAEALNAQGKKLIKQLDLVGAAQRFRAAMALSSDPRFAFNLCYTLEKSGQLVEAKQACETVMESGNARLGDKANRLLAIIEESLADGAPQPPPAPPGPGGSLRQPSQPEPAKPVATVPEAASPPKKARTSYGIAAGLSRATLDTSFGDPEAKLGFAIGGGLRVAIRPKVESIIDAHFVQRGAQTSSGGLEPNAELSTNYLDVGFASRWYLTEATFQPYIEAGMAISVLLFASGTVGGTDVEVNDLQSLDVSYSFGVGGRVALGARSLDIRARYMYGLLDTSSTDTGAVSTSGYNRTFLIQTGIWF